MKYLFIAILLFITSFLLTGVIIFVVKSFQVGREVGRLEYQLEYVKAMKKKYPECKKDGGYLVAEPFPGGKMMIGCSHFRSVDNGMKMRDHEFVVYEGEI